jgi:hypothetical protein
MNDERRNIKSINYLVFLCVILLNITLLCQTCEHKEIVKRLDKQCHTTTAK